MRRWDKARIVAGWASALHRADTLDGQAFQAAAGAMLADLEQLSPGLVRSRMAADLTQLLGSHAQNGTAALRYLDRSVQLGDEYLSDRSDWQRTRASARCLILMRACQEREPIDYRAAWDEVAGLAVGFADDPAVRPLTSATQAVLGLSTGQFDPVMVGRVLAEFGAAAGDSAEVAPLLALISSYLAAYQAQRNDDSAGAFIKLKQVMEESQQLPVPDSVRGVMAKQLPALELVESLLTDLPDTDPAAHQQRLLTLRQHLNHADITSDERASQLVALAAEAVRPGSDQARIEAGVADLRTVLALTPCGHPEQAFRLASLAFACYRHSEVTGSLQDVDEAIMLLEQARELAGGPSHPRWSMVSDLLAQLQQRRGDTADSSRTALEGLRGYVWQVLLQPDPAAARAVARTASEVATATAAMLLDGEHTEDAMRALDMGRGLMLFAATELRDPGTRLIDAGRPELADRWRTEQPPSVGLRLEVLTVLAEGTELLDTPSLKEIQAALVALDADALVYLVPRGSSTLGWAAIAPVQGPPRRVALPNLAVESGTEIDRYLSDLAKQVGIRESTTRVRGATTREVGSGTANDLEESVAAVSEWAWQAAMGKIVKWYPVGERTPHLVLIPMGDLARVPWQAARRPDGRYLLEQLGLSQAASARMLCESAAAEPVRLTSTGLFVADPDTEDPANDLRSARLEAYAIRQAFYPSATYLGRLPDGTVSKSGAGTPEQVRQWLRANDATAGGLLHLACHGEVRTALHDASSRLLLAGDDLTADELVGLLAGNTRHQIGLVVIAACHTGRSIHGYDEAYSLATTFLAAGVRSVLSTQWAVPDEETPLLMYLFHHYLVTERRPCWDALRQAQLWMLNDAREVPRGMPAPLRQLLAGSDPGRVAAWAGFVHWGQ